MQRYLLEDGIHTLAYGHRDLPTMAIGEEDSDAPAKKRMKLDEQLEPPNQPKLHVTPRLNRIENDEKRAKRVAQCSLAFGGIACLAGKPKPKKRNAVPETENSSDDEEDEDRQPDGEEFDQLAEDAQDWADDI